LFEDDFMHFYAHSIHILNFLMAIFLGDPGLAGCPLNSPSPFIPELCILLGRHMQIVYIHCFVCMSASKINWKLLNQLT